MVDSPVTYASVREYLKLKADTDIELVEEAVDAVNDLLVAWKGDITFPARYIRGGVMLAARLYRRRNSPGGVENMGQDIGVVYIQRNDPDIAMLLEIGTYRKPVVG